jgi:6-phosphogluconolactonase
MNGLVDSARLLVASADWNGKETAPPTLGPGAIVTVDIEERSGLLGREAYVSPVGSPSYIALNKYKSHAYVTSDWSRSAREPGLATNGRVTAFSIRMTGEATYINSEPTAGSVPCYVSVHPSGEYVFSADYGNGTITVHRVLENGSLGTACDVLTRSGSGPNHDRQAGPHAHMVTTSPDGAWVLVADLGTDELAVYELDRRRGTLVGPASGSARVSAGYGPRHLVFGADDAIFVVNELVSAVSVFSFDRQRGVLQLVNECATLEPGQEAVPNAPAGLALSHDRRFLYIANRGPNTVSTLRVDKHAVCLVGETDCGGEPRDLLLTHDHLYVANMMTDNLSVLDRNLETGVVSEPIQVRDMPAPSCIAYI